MLSVEMQNCMTCRLIQIICLSFLLHKIFLYLTLSTRVPQNSNSIFPMNIHCWKGGRGLAPLDLNLGGGEHVPP